MRSIISSGSGDVLEHDFSEWATSHKNTYWSLWGVHGLSTLLGVDTRVERDEVDVVEELEVLECMLRAGRYGGEPSYRFTEQSQCS